MKSAAKINNILSVSQCMEFEREFSVMMRELTNGAYGIRAIDLSGVLLTSTHLLRLRNALHENFMQASVIPEINLSNTGISVLPPDIFKNCDGLQSLHLNNNNLSSLPALPDRPYQLRFFDASNNPLQILNDHYFDLCNSLQRLFLGGTKLHKMPRLAFSVDLRELHLGYTPINDFSKDFFRFSINLQRLFLVGTNIKHLPDLSQCTSDLRLQINAGLLVPKEKVHHSIIQSWVVPTLRSRILPNPPKFSDIAPIQRKKICATQDKADLQVVQQLAATKTDLLEFIKLNLQYATAVIEDMRMLLVDVENYAETMVLHPSYALYLHLTKHGLNNQETMINNLREFMQQKSAADQYFHHDFAEIIYLAGTVLRLSDRVALIIKEHLQDAENRVKDLTEQFTRESRVESAAPKPMTIAATAHKKRTTDQALVAAATPTDPISMLQRDIATVQGDFDRRFNIRR